MKNSIQFSGRLPRYMPTTTTAPRSFDNHPVTVRKRQQPLPSRRRSRPNFPTLSIDSTVSWHSPVELFLVAEKFVKNIYTVQTVFIFIREGAVTRLPRVGRVLPPINRPIGGEIEENKLCLTLDKEDYVIFWAAKKPLGRRFLCQSVSIPA